MVDNAVGGTMGEKIVKETVDLYEMLGANSQQKNVKGRRGAVNEMQVNNEMVSQLIELIRQVSLLASRAQQNNEVCGLCGAFGHGANMCP